MSITEYGDFCTSAYDLALDIESKNIQMWYPTGYGDHTMYKIPITILFNDVSHVNDHVLHVGSISDGRLVASSSD